MLSLSLPIWDPSLSSTRWFLTFCVFSADPSSVRNMHCFPVSSSSISCTWAPPLADYDAFEVMCRRQDSGELVSGLRLPGDSSVLVLDRLDPSRRYDVMVMTASAGLTSQPAHASVVTMIDREYRVTD